MNEKFNALISQLQTLGYDPDNDDLMDLEMYSGYGYVDFYGPNRVGVALRFKDYELDLNGQGQVLKFFRRFTINTPTNVSIRRAEREFQVEMDVITLHSNIYEIMTYALEELSKVKVK